MTAGLRQRQRGQSLVEFGIAIFGFGILLLALLQAILFYRAKATIDYAAMEAARAGAVHGADRLAMEKGFARGMTPLLATATGSPSKADMFLTYGKAIADVTVNGRIDVISPTVGSFDDFKESQYDGTQALPNDSLNFRSATRGSRGGLSVQDANILKIKVTYRYPLIVPLIDRLIGTIDPVRSVAGGHTVYSLSIVAGATVRMQSPVTTRSNLAAR